MPRIPEKPILTVLFYVAVINLAALVIISMNIGGSAIGGHIENGRYLLNDHGRVTEVSEAMFTYMKWHEISVWITHAALIGSAFALALGDWLRERRMTNHGPKLP